MLKFSWISKDDGCGVIGYSFKCPYCDCYNSFVSEEFEPHEYEECGKESEPESELWGSE